MRENASDLVASGCYFASDRKREKFLEGGLVKATEKYLGGVGRNRVEPWIFPSFFLQLLRLPLTARITASIAILSCSTIDYAKNFERPKREKKIHKKSWKISGKDQPNAYHSSNVERLA